MNLTRSLIAALLLLTGLSMAHANEAEIRKALADRLKGLPKVDEVHPAAMPGLWEVRIGNEIRYTDATGNFLIEGDLIDLREGRNLTQERVDKLNAIDFAALPLKDAMVWKRGNGKRRIAVFADPNCRYCRAFEHTLLDAKDLTVYTFLIPILGGDSPEKAHAIWCAKDNTASYKAWMINNKPPAKPEGACDDSAIQRNLALANRLHIMGTPGILFEDGTRAPGAVAQDELERRLRAAVKG